MFNNILFVKFINNCSYKTSDKIRATIIFYLIRCLNTGDQETIEKVKQLCKDIIQESKYGLFSKFAAGIFVY